MRIPLRFAIMAAVGLLAGCGDFCSRADGGRYPNPANPEVEAVVWWSDCGASTSYSANIAIQSVGTDPVAALASVEGPTSTNGYGVIAGWVDSRTFEVRFGDCKNMRIGQKENDLGEVDIGGTTYFVRLAKLAEPPKLVQLDLPPKAAWRSN